MKSRRLILITVLLVATLATAAHAQSPFSLLYNLGTNSGDPISPDWIGAIAQGRDGNLYSTSQNGGKGVYPYGGTVFQLPLTPAGKVRVLHSFVDCSANSPSSGLTLGTDGNLYGTTADGGPPPSCPTNDGTVFRITTSGATFNVLHYFTGTDGSVPKAPPIQGTDGNFYGTTQYSATGYGTVYKMTPSGAPPWPVKQLHDFGTSDATHLAFPGALIQGTDGNFYGTTQGLGNQPFGAIFVISPDGKFFKVLHSFAGGTTDGMRPLGSIIQASDGNFYGTTEFGGSHNNGTVYQMTPAGKFKVIFSFDATGGLGYWPFAGLVQATDGNFYGAAYGGTGSAYYYGLLFRINPSTVPPKYSILYNFTEISDTGAHPDVSLFQHTNGAFYGDTYEGGSHGDGVLYRLNEGLHPFVALVTNSGKAGQVIQILGNGLTGATSVKFGTGSATSFKVVSDTYMTAVVPVTATTGAITVAVPSGFRVSSKSFRVLPAISSFSPTSGPVGTHVVITGTGLTQTTTVTFGGVKAGFTVNSANQVTATVPSGAVTGKIVVTTAGGSATSATAFTVT